MEPVKKLSGDCLQIETWNGVHPYEIPLTARKWKYDLVTLNCGRRSLVAPTASSVRVKECFRTRIQLERSTPMKVTVLALLLFLGASVGRAAVHTEVVEYKHGDVVLEGYLAYDDGSTERRPGVLVVHEWTGHNPYVRKRAEQLAG